MSAVDIVRKEIEGQIDATLSRCGIMYRIFSRAKSKASIEKKLGIKSEEYRKKGKKMQDLIGIRITLYFTDDVELVHSYFRNHLDFIDESVDENKPEEFCPKRLNLVLRVPEKDRQNMYEAVRETEYSDLIDDTYEVQIRTILSEGWHEVEHDLRYKCKEEWNSYKDESRLLNGIFASLESSEWSMLTLFDKLSYNHYKSNAWNSMMRNKMRIRFANTGFSDDILKYLSNNPNVAKSVFRSNRIKVLQQLMNSSFSYPLAYDTVLHLINRICVKNGELAKMEIDVLNRDLTDLFGEI